MSIWRGKINFRKKALERERENLAEAYTLVSYPLAAPLPSQIFFLDLFLSLQLTLTAICQDNPSLS